MYYFSAVLHELWLPARGWAHRRPMLAGLVGMVLCAAFARVAILAVFAMAGGAGNRTTTVTGTVLIDGTPLANGTIQFFPTSTGQPTSGQVVKGFFKARKVPVGSCRVLCIAVQETGTLLTEGGHTFPERVNLIPPPYRDGIDVVIDAGRTEILLDWRSGASSRH